MNPLVKNALVIALCAVTAFAGFLLLFKNEEKTEPIETVDRNVFIDSNASAETVKKENPLANRQIFFTGINDCILDRDSVVCLENPKENEDIYIMYHISDSDTGKTIFETGLIPSGEHIMWSVSDYLNEGDYLLNFTQIPYWRAAKSDEWQTLTSGNNSVNITIIRDEKSMDGES